MRTLRLLLFAACNRDCDMCCNKDWDLNALPVVTDFTGYDEILLTGGEPMLSPRRIRETVERIRKQNTTAKIYLYTAMVHPELLGLLLEYLDGVTLTLHEQADVTPELMAFLKMAAICEGKSLRLNVFKGVPLPTDVTAFGKTVGPVNGWRVKDGMEWIANCPLPTHETFGRV